MPARQLKTHKTALNASTEQAENIVDDMQNTDGLENTTDMGEDEEDDVDSRSSFSLQQCIDEFRARRIRRNSNQEQQQHERENLKKADVDTINQNRSNKEQERKCKPCKNGFCYCFTSDSGDGGGCGGATASISTARAAHQLRHARRSRKSESGQQTMFVQPSTVASNSRAKERKSAPACLKTTPGIVETAEKHETHSPKKQSINRNVPRRPLTAISRLETTTHDAPLIHIIQELRENCVVSEVRVNKHKLQKTQTSALKSPSKNAPNDREKEKIIRRESRAHLADDMSSVLGKEDYKSHVLEMPSGESIPVTRLEISAKSPQRKSGGGRLLQKRLSHTNLRYKPRDMTAPPPKPPRVSTGSLPKSSSSSTTTTSPSIREAERIVDDFLKKKGVPIPNAVDTNNERIKSNKNRMSFPLTHIEEKTRSKGYMPSCPSLSDIERAVDTKPRSYYGKNIKQAHEQRTKDITFGWKEPRVSEMLNYDTNGNREDFKSQAAQAEPQSIGWHAPPKLEIDTVDGAVRHNLASNVAPKGTPVKFQFNPTRKETNRKFGWRNLSAWPPMSGHGARIRRCPKSTAAFLKQSKKKILRLVTPKKNNKEPLSFPCHKLPTPYRTVGIQTTPQDLIDCYENSNTPHSPPGSYHSATQATTTPQNSLTTNTTTTTGQQTQSNNQSDPVEFDFSRTVSSPSRKTIRSTQRKLSFPNGCGGNTTTNSGLSREPPVYRTYRSYQTDFDQEVNISKMGCILSNIRARLEASDEHAVRTFEEIERREQLEQGIDCPDSFGIRQRTVVDVHCHPHIRSSLLIDNEPIYSEIEEDSIRLVESPQFDNKTGIESSSSAAGVDLENLYAKVNKPRKTDFTSMPLGKLLQDSLHQKRRQIVERLPILAEPSFSDVSYTSPAIEISTQRSSTPTISHCQSLNNIRVMEHNSPPNQNRNLSKSDLSLQRSEIFHENLCRSELIVEGRTLERLEKIDNKSLNRTTESFETDNVSYDVPDETDNNTAGSVLAKTTAFATPQKDATTNVSQPQKFLTKHYTVETQATQTLTSTSNLSEKSDGNLHDSHCNSCPVTPHKIPNSERQVMHSNSQPDCLNVSKYELLSTLPQPGRESGLTATASAQYKRLKQALQNSFRKSRIFVKPKRSSTPYPSSIRTALSTPQQPQQQTLNTTATSSQGGESCLNLDSLFTLDEATTVTEQIARAVSICRQLPELETSREMVEAERLLLFSTLKHDTHQHQVQTRRAVHDVAYPRQFSIATMHLPVKLEANLESYFNYYFIVTFECEGKIYSTQSTECRHGQAIFQNCNFEFKTQKYADDPEPVINCNIFMLRLRKVSTTLNSSMGVQDLSTCDISPLSSTPFGSLTSLNGITSRFRLYATFSINAHNFAPYSLIETEPSQPEKICLRATGNCCVPLNVCARQAQISINGCVLLHFPQFKHNGFLHVQNPFSMHNWNWRWCSLTGLQMQIWTDMNGISEEPQLRLDLHGTRQSLPLEACSRELCARARSFCLQCTTRKIGFEMPAATAAVFFAADDELELKQWLQRLNEVLSFISTWMQ